jgi:para-aminobenzoate synthetase component I
MISKIINSPISFPKDQLLDWANTFSHCIWLNPNEFEDLYPQQPFRNLLAVGTENIIQFSTKNYLQELKKYHSEHNCWLFGFLTYDLKSQTEQLASQNPDSLDFPEIYFFEPQYLFEYQDDTFVLISGEAAEIPDFSLDDKKLRKLKNVEIEKPIPNIQQRVSYDSYCENVEKIKQHIIEGDVYELNYCMEFFIQNIEIDAFEVYKNLNELSPMPFSCYVKIKDWYALCASPERFLKKIEQKLISQPIKGTAPRGKTPQEDAQNKYNLRHSEKELAENMMIVDLVRNDLARSCEVGTVQVPEIFGIYSFKQLHQMISTVTGNLHPHTHWTDALKNAFPMGSMTGAPKYKAMQLIENYEVTKRGLYSGSIGYISPDGNFDFNVVIRSILYNTQKQYLSFQVGSAITFDSVAEQEYQECLLKTQAIQNVLTR